HDYEGIAVRDDEKARLQANLGDASAMILRNHGLLTVGATVAEAFLVMFTLERACQVQVLAQSGGAALIPVDPRVLAGVRDALRVVTAGRMGGDLAWPALLRKLDRVNP